MLHEILTSNSWITPQIDYLLWLQNIRLQSSDIINIFFLYLTRIGEFFIPTLVICLIYWCFDTVAGLYLFTLNAFSLISVQIFKMMACVYRPWVLSNEIKPLEAAFKTAGGYSFPSGHSVMASSTWGGMAYLIRKKKWLCAILIMLILLIGFSRTYLGVHTPQDVVVGLLTGVVFIFLVNYFLKWLEKDKNRYLYSLVAINLIAIYVMYWMITKSYPMDMVDGKVLVDPHHAIYVAIIYVGWVTGFLNGAFLCKRFINFDAKQGGKIAKIFRGLFGALAFSVMFYFIEKYIFSIDQQYRICFSAMFIVGFYVTFIYPYIITKCQAILKKSINYK